MTKKAVAYFRVSTDKQGFRGLGMQAQQHAMDQFVENNGFELIASYEEVESGKRNDRPEFAKAKTHCIQQKATLLIAKLDRLARNVVFIGKLLEDNDFEFIALDMPNATKFEFHIRAALAEEEARLISERTRAGLARSEKPLGGANPVLQEKAIAKKKQLADQFAEQYRAMFDLLKASSETISYQDVARLLNRQGRKTRRGAKWSYITVKRLHDRLYL